MIDIFPQPFIIIINTKRRRDSRFNFTAPTIRLFWFELRNVTEYENRETESGSRDAKLSIHENQEFTMKRSNTWRDVDDFDFGHEEDEEDFMKVDAYATKTKQGKQEQQQQKITSNRRVAKNAGGRRKLVDDTMDWIARHRPTRASQLAVNQKKVEEFAEWARGLQVGIWLKNLAGKS